MRWHKSKPITPKLITPRTGSLTQTHRSSAPMDGTSRMERRPLSAHNNALKAATQHSHACKIAVRRLHAAGAGRRRQRIHDAAPPWPPPITQFRRTACPEPCLLRAIFWTDRSCWVTWAMLGISSPNIFYKTNWCTVHSHGEVIQFVRDKSD
jgi:hypothetical protein